MLFKNRLPITAKLRKNDERSTFLGAMRAGASAIVSTFMTVLAASGVLSGASVDFCGAFEIHRALFELTNWRVGGVVPQ